MTEIDAQDLFRGTTVVVVPHMDDGVLACGGTIAKLAPRECVHVVYATDGRGSPEPVIPWRDAVSPDLPAIRMAEATAAMGQLGIPAERLHFLGLPDGRLARHTARLGDALVDLLSEIGPTSVLMPFRYDGHPDHLALNRVLADAHRGKALSAQLAEYFVYHRYRLLPGGDIREYIRPQLLHTIDIRNVSAQKRAALSCFESQTTRFYPWQMRPNLVPQLLDETSQQPERFLRYDPAWPGSKIFAHSALWIRLLHRVEPLLKKRKDRAVALWQRGSGRHV